MILWLLTSGALASDPAALRHLHDDATVAVDVGTHGVSAAVDVGPLIGVTVDPGAYIGASVGQSMVLTGEARGWGMDGTVAGGAALLLATPGAAITGTAAIRGGFRGESVHVTGGLVVPAAVRLDWPVQLVVPTDLEVVAGGRLGDVWLGGRASFGGGFVAGHPPSLRWCVAGWVRLREF